MWCKGKGGEADTLRAGSEEVMHRAAWVSQQRLKQKGLGMWTFLCLEYVRIERTMKTNGLDNFPPLTHSHMHTQKHRWSKENGFFQASQTSLSKAKRLPAPVGSEKYLSLAGLGVTWSSSGGSRAALIRGSNIVWKPSLHLSSSLALLQDLGVRSPGPVHTACQPFKGRESTQAHQTGGDERHAQTVLAIPRCTFTFIIPIICQAKAGWWAGASTPSKENTA